MCRSKKSAAALTPSAAAAATPPSTGTTTASSTATSSSTSSSASLAAARAAVPRPPALYRFAELSAATNRFLAKKHDGQAFWRCRLRDAEAAVYQFPLTLRSADDVAPALARLGRSNHRSIAKLLGAAVAGGSVYIAYEYIHGATLASSLRNPRNPRFAALGSWTSRMQVADDVAQGLEYIHRHSPAGVHGSVRSGDIFVTEATLRGKIMLFGAANIARLGDAVPSRESDVSAFGLLLLELMSGQEPSQLRYDKRTKEFVDASVVETARRAADGGGVRGWVDLRLRDSFPVAVAERMILLALRCFAPAAAAARPDMSWVAGRVSKGYLESVAWEEAVKLPDEISVTVAPR